MEEPRDEGDLLEVPDQQQLDKDPNPKSDPTHTALGDGGPDDLSDVEEGDDDDREDWDDPEETDGAPTTEEDSSSDEDASGEDEEGSNDA